MNHSPARYLSLSLLACGLCCFPSLELIAQSYVGPWISWTVQEENDNISIADDSNGSYTNNFRVTLLRHPDVSPSWTESFGDWWCYFACGDIPRYVSSGFAFGQALYTPNNIDIPELISGDRAYAGWLYAALLLQISDADDFSQQHSFELQFGIVGPDAGGEWLQSELHELIDKKTPRGWSHQLPNELGFNFVYQYRRRIGTARFNRHFDFSPHFGGALGTISISANAGATLRAGWNISGFPQGSIAATAEPRGVRSRWEFYFFVGAEGRLLAHNIFLDGTVFRDSHQVDKEDFVYDLIAGFSVRYENWRLQYTFGRRSDEFMSAQEVYGGRHDFGSVVIGVERSF